MKQRYSQASVAAMAVAGPMAMPAKGGNPDLTNTDIESVHTYLHQQFGCG